jgi:hypothetical protein
MRSDINIIEMASSSDVISAISQYKTSLNRLIIQPAIQEVITTTSRRAAQQFNVDEADLASFLSHKLPVYFPSINTVDINWPEQLISWSSTVVTNRSRNILKHKKTEKTHEELVTHLNSIGKRNKHRVFKSPIPTPEDELSIKEQEPIWAARTTDIHSRVRRVITEDILIADLWSKGFSPRMIAEYLNKPDKTIYGKLEKIYKAVILEIGIIETPTNRSLVKQGLRELYGSALQDLV